MKELFYLNKANCKFTLEGDFHLQSYQKSFIHQRLSGDVAPAADLAQHGQHLQNANFRCSAPRTNSIQYNNTFATSAVTTAASK